MVVSDISDVKIAVSADGMSREIKICGTMPFIHTISWVSEISRLYRSPGSGLLAGGSVGNWQKFSRHRLRLGLSLEEDRPSFLCRMRLWHSGRFLSCDSCRRRRNDSYSVSLCGASSRICRREGGMTTSRLACRGVVTGLAVVFPFCLQRTLVRAISVKSRVAAIAV